MPYVMVPVPEDQVEAVMQHIVRLMSQTSIEPWDEASIQALFGSIDEPSRALLSSVARASMGSERLSEPDAAAMVQLSWRETMGLLREVNDYANDNNRPPLIVRRTATEMLPNGRTREIRLLTMSEEFAPLVEAADRKHLLSAEHPLGPGRA
jgi:hypothetical protein